MATEPAPNRTRTIIIAVLAALAVLAAVLYTPTDPAPEPTAEPTEVPANDMAPEPDDEPAPEPIKEPADDKPLEVPDTYLACSFDNTGQVYSRAAAQLAAAFAIARDEHDVAIAERSWEIELWRDGDRQWTAPNPTTSIDQAAADGCDLIAIVDHWIWYDDQTTDVRVDPADYPDVQFLAIGHRHRDGADNLISIRLDRAVDYDVSDHATDGRFPVSWLELTAEQTPWDELIPELIADHIRRGEPAAEDRIAAVDAFILPLHDGKHATGDPVTVP